jgi:hypothetical protein
MINKVAGAPRVASTTSRTTPQGHSALSTPEQHLGAEVPRADQAVPISHGMRNELPFSSL